MNTQTKNFQLQVYQQLIMNAIYAENISVCFIISRENSVITCLNVICLCQFLRNLRTIVSIKINMIM